MKSKLFTLFAAFVLLFSAQASAQAYGDVNGDGKVDEQDIAAILEIMAEAGGVKEQTKYYYYVGQTAVTADNYTTLATKTTEKLASIDYTTEKFGKVYILTPDIVTSIKIFEYSGNGYGNEKPSHDTSFNVAGCKLWVTSVMGGKAPQRYDFGY